MLKVDRKIFVKSTLTRVKTNRPLENFRDEPTTVSDTSPKPLDHPVSYLSEIIQTSPLRPR